MNTQRRCMLRAIVVLYEKASEMLAKLVEDEETAFGNMPMKDRKSDKGKVMLSYIESMNAFLDNFDIDALRMICDDTPGKKRYTYRTLLAEMQRRGANFAEVAIGRMMSIVEEETGNFPEWSDTPPDWVLRNCLPREVIG